MAVTKSAVRNQQVTKALQWLRKKMKNRGKEEEREQGMQGKGGKERRGGRNTLMGRGNLTDQRD